MVLAMSAFIAYALEDALFNRLLIGASQTSDQSSWLKVYTPDAWREFSADQVVTADYGEIAVAGRHYHYRKSGEGDQARWLVLDASELSVFSNAKGPIIMFYGAILFLLLLASTFVARRVSMIAVRPFQKLIKSFSHGPQNAMTIEGFEDVQEMDIRQLALRFQEILHEKHAFYQGISHELRTPLQNMKNSMTLLQLDHPEIASDRSLITCQKSITRMERISEAFLWLTHDGDCAGQTDVNQCVHRVLGELKPVLEHNKLSCDLAEEATLYARIPDVVMELMVFNLVSNAIVHSGEGGLSISITANAISFSNSLDPATNKEGFSVGLSIVQRLASRFSLTMVQNRGDDGFVVRLGFAPS